MGVLQGIIRGEAIVDGDASSGIEILFYKMTTTGLVPISLGATDTFIITDIFISQDSASTFAIVEDIDSDGLRLIKGTKAKDSNPIVVHLNTPFECQPNHTLKYFGHTSGLNVCLVRGRIT